MTVSAEEFLRRFLLHVLPRGFVRIRHFGFLANRRRGQLLSRCKQILTVATSTTDRAAAHSQDRKDRPALWVCPLCGGTMIVIERLTPAQMRLRSPLRPSLPDAGTTLLPLVQSLLRQALSLRID